MTPAERYALIDANTPEVDGVHYANCYFDWGWKGCGFGQFSFSFDSETGKWECSNELMSPERSRKLLHAFADYVADNLKPIIEADRDEVDERRAKHDSAE